MNHPIRRLRAELNSGFNARNLIALRKVDGRQSCRSPSLPTLSLPPLPPPLPLPPQRMLPRRVNSNHQSCGETTLPSAALPCAVTIVIGRPPVKWLIFLPLLRCCAAEWRKGYTLRVFIGNDRRRGSRA